MSSRRSMKIRRICADEGLALRALRLAALADSPMAYGSTFAREDAYPEAVWHERAAAGAAGGNVVTIVAEQDGRLVAMASGLGSGPETQDGSQPTMVGVFVERTARRQGVGVALIETIVGWARARGATRLTVWITADNEPAHALYRRCDFHLTGATKPNAHTPTLAELEMARNLG
jgi:GNAT superfamily N-acetyltransferase